MSNPGPPGGDERPLAGPDAGMGLPESGTQHATSTDFALPVEAAGEPEPLTSGGPVGEARPPVPPAYEDPSELVDPAAPAYEEPTDLLAAVPEAEATALGAAGTPAYDALAAETRFGEPAPKPGGGLLAQVKAFADERPAAFLGAALVAGWLVGKLLSSSDDDDED